MNHRTKRLLLAVPLLALPLLAGCQWNRKSGVYRVWLDWRTPLQPSMVFERNRLAHGGTSRTLLVNWDDRHFVDPRYRSPQGGQPGPNDPPPAGGDSILRELTPVPEPTDDPQPPPLPQPPPQPVPSGTEQPLPMLDERPEGPVATDPRHDQASHIPAVATPSQTQTTDHSAEAAPVDEAPAEASQPRRRIWNGFSWGWSRAKS